MSDLQIALVLIGIVVVGGVLAFNWWQERRFRKQASAAFDAPVNDVLMQPAVARHEPAARIEPELHEPTFGEQPIVPDEADANLESHLPHPSAPVSPSPAVPAPTPLRNEPRPAASITAPVAAAPYDELIEYRIRLGAENVLANVFADAFNQSRQMGKNVRWLGLPVAATQWEEVQPWRDVHYQQVMVTAQLADRNGAIQEDMLSQLCALLQHIAQTHHLKMACDDTGDAMERAQSIDRFCVDVDVLIGLNVVARGDGTVELSRIVREAEQSGMVLGRDGVFQLLDSRGELLYALCNHDAEPFTANVAPGHESLGVTLQFDVPRVPDGLKVFDTMVAFGRKLANEVGGLLVDDNLRPLTDAGIEKIRSQLTQLYERMESRGVPSGSRRALRLFS
ncbi:MAG: cell division protein ZipA C-terminal FtsZ-binding domain-containing protein [Thiobacillus sp.]